MSSRWPRPFASVGVVATIALAGCKVGPDYVRPALAPPEAFKSRTAVTDAALPALGPDWWRLYRDAELDRLIGLATASNQTLLQAVAAIDQARAQARAAASFRLPAVTLNPSFSRQRSSSTTKSQFTGASTTGSTISDWLLPIDLSYEIDVWGRVRRSIESARAQARATADDAASIRLNVQTDVAAFYYALRMWDWQIDILDRTVVAFAEQVRVLSVQVETGLASPIVLSQARTQLEATIAQQRDARRARDVQEHALAILCGQPAPTFSVAALPPREVSPPEVPAGLPVMLLSRRPDVAAAEQAIVAANADVGVAMAAFYPQFNLLSSAGFESANLNKLLDWKSRVASIVPGVTLPLFDGGRRKATLEASRAQYRQTVAAYAGQVLIAYGDVEDALTDLRAYADEMESLKRAVAASEAYLRVAHVQYRIGLADYLTVVDAERTLLGNQLALAQTNNLHVSASVRLIRALGGGWDARMEAP